jgi:hypothetical protein
MREAIRNAESGSSFIVKAPVLGQREETIQFSASKANKHLCAVQIETSMQVNGPLAPTAVTGAKQVYMIDDIRIKADNQLRVDSSDTIALIEWADLVMDRVQSDTILGATGVAHSYHILPVSGVGAADILIDIDYANFASLYSLGTEGAKTIVITPLYSTVDIPIFSIKTGSTIFMTTGNQKLPLDADYIGTGFLSEFVGIPDATTLDDLAVKQSDGLELFNAKYLATARFWQNMFTKTIATNSWGCFVESTHPWTLNDRVQIDVSAGTPTIRFVAIFKNSSTESQKGVAPGAAVATPKVASTAQPTTQATTGRLDANQIINKPAQGGFNLGRIFGA